MVKPEEWWYVENGSIIVKNVLVHNGEIVKDRFHLGGYGDGHGNTILDPDWDLYFSILSNGGFKKVEKWNEQLNQA